MKARSLVLTIAALGAIVAGPVRADVSCAGPADGGEWRRYGSTLDNSRAQSADTTLDPATVGGVTAIEAFDAEAAQPGGGTFSNTPLIIDGCVYLASSTGFVFALNADSLELVWASEKMPGEAAGALVGGVITGSPVVADGKVYVAVSKARDPFIGVLDQATGATLGMWPVLREEFRGANNTFSNTIIASPVVWNGLLFQGIMAGEASMEARGGWAVLDAETGELLVQDWTIDDASYEAGYAGASIWCSPAMDAETGFLYACGGNPASKRVEHRNSNALLKFDLNRFLADGITPNPDFGGLVDGYKGDVDQYYPGLDRQPVCDAFAEDINVVWSQACLQLDLDFGASPNLFTVDVAGEPVKLVGALQKSGVYHAIYADNMQRAWTSVVGTPCVACNASSTAVDGDSVYVAATAPGHMMSLSKDAGRYGWASPLLGGTHFQPVSVANGVVYTMDNYGNLNAFDAATGVPLLKQNLALDTQESASETGSQGVAIARNKIYALSGRFMVVYG